MFASAIYTAYFVDRLDHSNNRVLSEIAAPFGLTEDEVGEIVKSAAMKDRFRAEVEAAIERKVYGAPTFIVNGERFWGVDRLDQLDKWLRSGGW